MFIHELAKQTGVPTKTIRYYESIGLPPPAQRAANNYRQYTRCICYLLKTYRDTGQVTIQKGEFFDD